jgi:hypothetical protein
MIPKYKREQAGAPAAADQPRRDPNSPGAIRTRRWRARRAASAAAPRDDERTPPRRTNAYMSTITSHAGPQTGACRCCPRCAAERRELLERLKRIEEALSRVVRRSPGDDGAVTRVTACDAGRDGARDVAGDARKAGELDIFLEKTESAVTSRCVGDGVTRDASCDGDCDVTGDARPADCSDIFLEDIGPDASHHDVATLDVTRDVTDDVTPSPLFPSLFPPSFSPPYPPYNYPPYPTPFSPLPCVERDSGEKDSVNRRTSTLAEGGKGSENGFDAFWRVYPRRVGKAAARKAWLKATRVATPEEIIAGAERAARSWEAAHTSLQYVPHPATWLNAERWTDEDRAIAPVERKRNYLDYTADFLKELVNYEP